jgi:Circularly permutated YpsA SLOG family
VITAIHGGQTGVDRGAHEAAIVNGWAIDGYMPRGARDEFGKIPPDVARFLREHESANYAGRTEANVYSCDALLVVVRDADNPRATPGTAKTIDLAAGRNLPRIVVEPNWSAIQIAKWIWSALIMERHEQQPLLLEPHARTRDPLPGRLMIAGPRESKWPGACVGTAGLLRRVGLELRQIKGDASNVRSTGT